MWLLTVSSIAKIKLDILPWLQEKNIYISGDDITASNEIVSLFFFLEVPFSIAFKTVERLGMTSLPSTMLNDGREQHALKIFVDMQGQGSSIV